MRFFLIIFISALISINLFAKIVLISDLDDTVRKAHVLKLAHAGGRIIKGVKPFEDLQAIYKNLEQVHGDEIDFFYVSSSYPFLYNASKWLDKYNFPKGEVFQRSLKQENHRDSYLYKTTTITNLIERYSQSDTQFIFFGDNGEHDPQIFKDIINNKNIQNSKVYIRDVSTKAHFWYDRLEVKKEEDQLYFLTEIDLLDEDFVSFLEEDVVNSIKLRFEKKIMIPNYIVYTLKHRVRDDCEDTYNNYFERIFCKIMAKSKAESLIDQYYLNSY